MAKRITVPLGRLQEAISKLSDDEKQRAAIETRGDLFADRRIEIFITREFMLNMLRQQGRDGPWSPVVKPDWW